MNPVHESLANYLVRNPSDNDLAILNQQGLLEIRTQEEYAALNELSLRKTTLYAVWHEQLQKKLAATGAIQAAQSQAPRNTAGTAMNLYETAVARAIHLRNIETDKEELSHDELMRCSAARTIISESIETSLGYVCLSQTGKCEAKRLKELVDGAHRERLESKVNQYLIIKKQLDWHREII